MRALVASTHDKCMPLPKVRDAWGVAACCPRSLFTQAAHRESPTHPPAPPATPQAVRPPPDLSRAQAETLRPLLARLRLQLALQAWRQALRRFRLQAAVAARCAHGADAGRVRTALLGWREMALPSAEALAVAARVEAQRKEAARRASLRAWAEAAHLSRWVLRGGP